MIAGRTCSSADCVLMHHGPSYVSRRTHDFALYVPDCVFGLWTADKKIATLTHGVL